MLTDMRVSKSDCDASTDSRMNQVLLTNEHGDIFKRQINLDECDSEPYNENESIPSSPVESEYFYEQFIDYPLNDSASEQNSDLRQPTPNLSPFSRNMTMVQNDTVLNYDQHKLQQLQNKNNGGSTFTFFGMPLPSLSNLWSGGNAARKSTSRADVDANGKSRLRNFRPRPGEIVENFQFSNNVQLPPTKPTPPTLMNKDKEPTNIHPPPPPLPIHPIAPFPSAPNGAFSTPNGPFLPPNGYFANGNVYSNPIVEKGGFIPMLPGRKGFTPIQNPFPNETETVDVQETVSTELRPNVDLEFDDSLDDIPDNKYPVLVPTVSANPSINRPTQSPPQSNFNVSSLKKSEITAPTKSSNGISLIRPSTPSAALPIITSTTTRRTATEMNAQPLPEIDRSGLENEAITKNIQKISSKTPKTPVLPPVTQKPEVIIPTTAFYPTFMPNSSDVINLSKNRTPANGTTGNGIVPGSALSALVAPGAQQGVYRAPGRSVITKVFNNTMPSSSFTPTVSTMHTPAATPKPNFIPSTTITTTTSTKQPLAQKLPTAEEYLRTTSQDNSIKDNTTPSHLNKTPNIDDVDDLAKGDMNWYYSNYNRSAWKEPQLDPGLYRFKINSGSGCLTISSHFTSIIFTLILVATKLLD